MSLRDKLGGITIIEGLIGTTMVGIVAAIP